MADSTSDRPVPTPPPPPPYPPAPQAAHWQPGPSAPRQRGRGLLITVAVACSVVAGLLAGGGATWWVLKSKDDGNAMAHVEILGGKSVVKEDPSDLGGCDDTDEFTYNDCDPATETYEFAYKITNDGDDPANYSVVVNAFDKDGEFVAQTYIGATHVEPGKTDSDEGEFNEYSTLEDGRDLSDIASVKTGHVERVALAN
ncbi:hypothetical protein ACIP2X_01605 [Streptomyces sp. NPDC089424]|uniref:hypothetical protein n=1 Tax=Streptomyces sp. NPDC089424 TaxID=3365917 RepID=UPI00381DCF35